MILYKKMKTRWNRLMSAALTVPTRQAPKKAPDNEFMERTFWRYPLGSRYMPLVEPTQSVDYNEFREEYIVYVSAWFMYMENSISQEVSNAKLDSVCHIAATFHSPYHGGQYFYRFGPLVSVIPPERTPT